MVWVFFKKLNTEMPYDLTIPLLIICLQRIESRDLKKYLYTHVSSTIIPNSQKWTQLKYPSMDKWIKCGVREVEYYSALNRKEILIYATALMDFKGVIAKDTM